MADKGDNKTYDVNRTRFVPFVHPSDAVRAEHLPVYKDLVTILPSGTCMLSIYERYHQQYQNFQSKPTDVWISSYPKSGTTWSQELVWCLLFTLDDPRINQMLSQRSPFFEWDSLFADQFSLKDLPDGDLNKTGVMWDLLHKDLPSPRPIKTHLHRALLPADIKSKGVKILYVCRDPRDLCVSLYYHSIKLDGYTGSFDQFVDIFLGEALPWSPFWSHVLSYWEQRDDPNVCFIRFEDMKTDLRSTLKQIASFLGVQRPGCPKGELTDKELTTLTHHLDFGTMKNNEAVNNDKLFETAIIRSDNKEQKEIKFMRKGKVGDHKDHLTTEHLKRFQLWTEAALKDSDFPYYRNY